MTAPNGQPVTGYADLPGPDDEKLESTIDTDRTRDNNIQFFNANYREETVRFALVEREIAIKGNLGVVKVQVGQTRLAREVVAKATVLSALLPIAAVMVLALVAVWFGVDVALRPLRRIRDEIADRSTEDLRPIDTAVPIELRPFVEATNGFMRRLSANVETLKSFIADASHQMRTPLAALLAQAQAASDSKPRELRRSLEAIERNATKLTHLLNQLLSDTTVAHRADVRKFQQMDLLDTMREAIRETAGAAEGSDVRLRTRLKKAPMAGDPVMLVEALKNVVHNAMLHGSTVDDRGSAHSTVEIELVQLEDSFEVKVSDRGPGIPAGHKERIFERFTRIKTDNPGAGIGLAIVRRAIDVHNGTIAVEDRHGGGLTFRIKFPFQ